MRQRDQLHDEDLVQARQARRQRTLALLARDLVHDFRNTLGAVVAFVDIAGRGGSAELDQRLLRRSSESLDRGVRMLDLVMRHAFRQESGVGPVSIEDFMRDLFVMLDSFTRRRGMIMHTECGLDRSITIDQRAVRDLVVRIALHGIETCPEGSTIRLVAVEDSCAELAESITLRLCLEGGSHHDTVVRALLEQDIGALGGVDDFAQAIVEGRMALALCGGALRYDSDESVRTFLFDLPIAIPSTDE